MKSLRVALTRPTSLYKGGNGEEVGPLRLFNIQKKGTGKNPIPLLSVGYRKDVFMFFVDRVELSEFLMKSFALLTMKSKPTVLMKFSA